ncbi:MAG: tRNA (5-methylaminomethyl-2-thiouridine)(34)-methyltransferase MnmD [Succinivibrionaceae bacterium]|nr:tRNA (5-methylaminomethyl-2-thiouridine)(34)-methyltransferase MnmD [Succinivibrionaceae bacterium]
MNDTPPKRQIGADAPAAPLEFARIDFTDPQNPRSLIYPDIYFSASGLREETLHTFIRGNNLKARLEDASEQRRDGSQTPAVFTIAETGFGTGSNLIVLLEAFRDLLKRGRIRLRYVSFEKHPLTLEDMKKAQDAFCLDHQIAGMMLEAYAGLDFAKPATGFDLPDLHTQVNLYLGDIRDRLPEFAGNWRHAVNAWFLDGYSPSCNGDLWNDDLYRAMAKTAAGDCTLATFTVSGRVRRGLAAAGFAIQKRPGYGSKREMTVGRIADAGDGREG